MSIVIENLPEDYGSEIRWHRLMQLFTFCHILFSTFYSHSHDYWLFQVNFALFCILFNAEGRDFIYWNWKNKTIECYWTVVLDLRINAWTSWYHRQFSHSQCLMMSTKTIKYCNVWTSRHILYLLFDSCLMSQTSSSSSSSDYVSIQYIHIPQWQWIIYYFFSSNGTNECLSSTAIYNITFFYHSQNWIDQMKSINASKGYDTQHGRAK